MTDDTPDHHYATLLGLGTEWKVMKVGLNVPGRRIDVFLESAIRPVCGKFGSVYDQRAERVWRHLDTMQFETPVHAKTPRVKCADHGVKVIEPPWAAKSSRFTLLFEAFARVMTDIDSRRVLDVARGRTGKGAEAPIDKALNPLQRFMVCGVAMDMSAPFEKAVHKFLPCADVVFGGTPERRRRQDAQGREQGPSGKGRQAACRRQVPVAERIRAHGRRGDRASQRPPEAFARHRQV